MIRQRIPLALKLCALLVLTVATLVWPRPEPASASGVTAVAGGLGHTCALTSIGGVRCWGLNDFGQLGDGTTMDRTTPVDVSGLNSGVATIDAQFLYSCALTTVGGIKCWGLNEFGALGAVTTESCSTFSCSMTPVDVTGLTTGVAAIATGTFHACAVTTVGSVKCWGVGYGSTPVDVPALTSGVAAIAAGGGHTCAVTTAGGVKCWGSNRVGQLGDGTTTDSSTPVDVVGLGSGVAAVAAGGDHTCALTTAGGLKCWGRNATGQLGDGTSTNRTTPVDVVGLTSGVASITTMGTDHSCAVTIGGGAKCWGWNERGQLGDGTKTDRATAVDVVGLTSGVATLTAAGVHTCAVTTAGGLKCWGDNDYGQLGDGNRTQSGTPVDVTGLGSGVTAVAADGLHSCALTTAGGVKCWGINLSGQLGDGTTVSRATPVDVSGLASGVAAVSAGGIPPRTGHTCDVTAAGGVKCWGLNGFGELGDGTDGNFSPTPVNVAGLESGVAEVAAGSGHTCALTATGGLKCWGDNGAGQLGDGTATNRSTPVDVVGLGSGVAAVAAGAWHTCALTTVGGVRCWGFNFGGQLGDGTTTNRSTPVDVVGLASGVAAIAAGRHHTCAVITLGGVRCWGLNGFGEIGDGTTNSRTTPVDVVGLTSGVASITAGFGHTCAVTTSGGAKCWGLNRLGQLGDGTITDRTTPVDVLGLPSGVDQVSAGVRHTCAVTTAGSVKCWGDMIFGQLGEGTFTTSTTPVDVIGLGESSLVDSDGDGCTEKQELGSNGNFGGGRNPKNFWDFFDTPNPNPPVYGPQRDRVVDVADIVRVVDRFGTTGDPTMDPLSTPPKAGYHPAYDRTMKGPNPWNTGLPDGVIDVVDIVLAVAQFGHSCA